MIERRYEVHTPHNTPGTILLDEHRSVPCIVSDQSGAGISVTLLNSDEVPDTFILTIDDADETLVCRAAWRKPDQIGCTADVLVPAWVAGPVMSQQSRWF